MSSADSIRQLLEGLNFHVTEGEIHLSEPTSLGPLATKTLRGMAGHALVETHSELLPLFKSGSDRPPAYSFSPRFGKRGIADVLPFRLVTWDRDGELAPALLHAIESFRGASFGKLKKGIRMTGFELGPVERAVFRPADDAPTVPIEIHLVTPLQLRTRRDPRTNRPGPATGGKRRRPESILRSGEMTFGHLCRAAVIRLNNLSRSYGNGSEIELRDVLATAALVPERARRLHDETASRHSSTQNRDIFLDGVTGTWTVGPVPPELFELLQAVGLVQVGGQTASGCGCIAICEA